jgi:ubiquitin carboxyl-terminal hydrolase 26/29/37
MCFKDCHEFVQFNAVLSQVNENVLKEDKKVKHENDEVKSSMNRVGVSKASFYGNGTNKVLKEDKKVKDESDEVKSSMNPVVVSKASFYGTKRRKVDTENTKISRALTPKQSKREENVENETITKSWNRTNSKTTLSVEATPSQPARGFSNLGNTCYLNAILQVFLHMEVFANDLIQNYQFTQQQQQQQNTILVDNQKCSLYNCLCKLKLAMDTNDELNKVQLLQDIKTAISTEANMFSGSDQHDAHEFMCQLLDQLKDNLDKLQEATTTTTTTTTTCQKEEEEMSKKINLANPVVDNFQFEVTHAIHCKNCNNVTKKSEEYNNLCLELPNINKFRDKEDEKEEEEICISLQDALDIFFNDETISDFSCQNCSSRQDIVIQRKFSRLPRILILHLKRYDYVTTTTTTTSQDTQKNASFIHIPRYLTLQFLLTQETGQLKLPKKIPNNISMTTPCKSQSKSKSQSQVAPIRVLTLFKETLTPKKAPLQTSSINVYNNNNNNNNNKRVQDISPTKSLLDKYDRHNYAPEDVSEDEQLNMALAMSLEQQSKPSPSPPTLISQ